MSCKHLHLGMYFSLCKVTDFCLHHGLILVDPESELSPWVPPSPLTVTGHEHSFLTPVSKPRVSETPQGAYILSSLCQADVQRRGAFWMVP